MSREIKFYNSLSKKEEVFEPLEDGKARIYHCGPTVYKRQHIGNMRRFLFADFLRRTLEFFGYELLEITNITDVGHLTQDDTEEGEDKLEKEAARKKLTPADIAEKETKTFLDDIKTLNIKRSHKYPKATGHIQDMQDLIGVLLEKGFAYTTEVGVFFDISKFKSYGQLSGNTTDKLEVGARLAVRPEKRNPGDFALWLTDNPRQLQQWDSPWGRGYPGWHIECSAMSRRYLGDEIDIHTGGEDNKFPHHENEIAQSEAATGKTYVRLWMHNAHLQMSGQKLAKREGEQITMDTIVERGFSPIAFRLLVLGSHYRTKIDFSWEKLAEAQNNLKTIQRLLERLEEIESKPAKVNENKINHEVMDKFADALAMDLNTPLALATVYDYIKDTNHKLDQGLSKLEAQEVWHTLVKMDGVLGVFNSVIDMKNSEDIPTEIAQMLDEREEARKQGDFDKADQIREKMELMGYRVDDTQKGPRLEKI